MRTSNLQLNRSSSKSNVQSLSNSIKIYVHFVEDSESTIRNSAKSWLIPYSWPIEIRSETKFGPIMVWTKPESSFQTGRYETYRICFYELCLMDSGPTTRNPALKQLGPWPWPIMDTRWSALHPKMDQTWSWTTYQPDGPYIFHIWIFPYMEPMF